MPAQAPAAALPGERTSAAAADIAAPTEAVGAAAPAAESALKSSATPEGVVQQPYGALVATSEPSSSGTVALEQPPVAPTANSAPRDTASNIGVIAGLIGLGLLIVAGIGVALGRRRRR
jgi:hypothetical protein